MSIGKLRHRITVLKRKIEVVDGNTSETWDEHVKLWSSVEPLTGREYFSAAAVNSEDTVKFKTRYSKTLTDIDTSSVRILFDKKEYDVYAVQCPFERKKELIWMAKQYGGGTHGRD